MRPKVAEWGDNFLKSGTDKIILYHTEVEYDFKGKGVGLVEFAVNFE